MTAKGKAEAALLGTTMIWGGSFVVTKLGLEGVPPLLLTALRFTIAAVFFGIFSFRQIAAMSRRAMARGAILGIFLYLGIAVQTTGMDYTTASKSAFITSTMVLFVPLLQVIIEKRAPKLGNILGIVIVVGGLWLLTSPGGGNLNIGDMLTVVSAILFAFYVVYLDVVSKEMTTMQLSFSQTACAAMQGWVVVALVAPMPVAMTTRTYFALGYLGLMCSVFTTIVQTRFQKDTTPTRAAIIFTIEPVIASACSYVVLGEVLGTGGILGAALIIIGVVVSELSDAIPVLNKPLGEMS